MKVRNVAAFAALAALIVVGSLWLARSYQTPRARTLIEERYLKAARAPLATIPTSTGDGRVLLTMPRLWEGSKPASTIAAEYLVLELSTASCSTLRVPVLFKYRAITPDGDLSRGFVVDLDSAGAPSVVLFPVFFDPVFIQFAGIQVMEADVPCVASVSRMVRDRRPDVLLAAVLSPQWKEAPLYEALTAFENAYEEAWPDQRPRERSAPRLLVLPRTFVATPFAAPLPDTEFYGSFVERRQDGTFVVRGRGPTHAILIPDQQLQTGVIAVATGVVRAGGVTLILSEPNGRSTNAAIDKPGPFRLAVEALKPDNYTVVIDTYAVGGRLWKRLPPPLTEWLLTFPGLPVGPDIEINTFGWIAPYQRRIQVTN